VSIVELLALPFELRGRSRQRPAGKKSRKSSAAEERRRKQRENVNREIDALVAEFYAAFPRENAGQTGAIYARYSTQFQDSVVDQVRTLLEHGASKSIFVPRDSIFFDLAERGSLERRPGLAQLHQALAARQFQVLLVFTSNRLYRKAYKAMKFIEEEIVEAGLRCIFVKQDIDTADKQRWRVVLQFTSSMDEFYSTAYGENIRAAHLGLAGKGFVYSTLCVGYHAEPIPGELTRRKKPRCRIAIDEIAASYVRQIFAWFVVDQLSIDEIVRRLNNDPSAPRPTKSPGGWTHHSVVAVLSNPRYIAQWPC